MNNSQNSNDIAKKLLEQGLAHFTIRASEAQVTQWLGFVEVLHKWNQKMNLTAVRTVPKMVSRHLFESLAIQGYVHGDRIIDVGCGAGIPGIPLAIMHPDKQFYLLDSNQKKQIFVNQAAKGLLLSNAQGVHSMVEQYQPQQKFSTILTRAFKPLGQMIAMTQHLLAEDGRFLAMLGKLTPESTTIPPGYRLCSMVDLKIPEETAERHLAIIEKDHRQGTL